MSFVDSRRFKRTVYALICIASLLVIYDIQPYKVIYNHTPSMKLGFYLADTSKTDHIGRGTTVAFKYEPPYWAVERKYANPGTQLLKHVGAIPGDYISYVDERVYRCNGVQQDVDSIEKNCKLLGIRKEADSAGRTIKDEWLMQGLNNKVPKKAYYMVSNNHENSFDSRYMGWIPERVIIGKIEPIWTWD